MIRFGVALAAISLSLSAVLAPSAAAQACANGMVHFKNDTLADIPSGFLTVSVIPGLCEQEGCGAVFTLPGGGNVAHYVRNVRIGLGSQGGVQGNFAAVSIEIYNGVTWSGNNPVLGPKVFDSTTQGAGTYQIFSTGLNEIDLTNDNVKVGGPGVTNFAVCFRMQLNPNGTCATGFTTNFITDNHQSGFFGCNAAITPPKKNLLFILGQGWKDPATATVSGIPLCPLYYSGNWLIRACAEPEVCQPNLGSGGPGNSTISMCGQALATGNTATFSILNATPNVNALLFISLFNNPTFIPPIGGTLVPFPITTTVTVPIGPTGSLVFPGVPGGGGPLSIYVQSVSPDPSQVKGYELSNALRLDFQP